MSLLRLTQAQAPLTQEIAAWDESGQPKTLLIPCERALTVYVDRSELLTIMTLGSAPELLVLGWLRNQRLVTDLAEIDSITVDWDCGEHGEGAAAVKTHAGLKFPASALEKKTVTTGCGQGSMFGGVMTDLEHIALDVGASIRHEDLLDLLNAVRLQESTYKSAGSVHGCALFEGAQMLYFVEDVGRHNAIDTIAGWMWMNGVSSLGKTLYTTGRLTSEMVIKAAQMGVPIVVSRSGITQMGHQMAQRLAVCAIGRAINSRYLIYTAPHRVTRPRA